MNTRSYALALLALLCGPIHAGGLSGIGIGSGEILLYGCESASPPAGWVMRYVAQGGGGAGTQSSPFASITAAFASVSPSTKLLLCVASGNYTETLDFGTRRSVMLIGAFNSSFSARDPVAQPTQIRPAAATSNVISAQSPVEITLDGLDISGSLLRGVRIALWDSAPPSTESVTVLNSHIHGNGATSNQGSSATGGISIGGGRYPNVTVAHCLIENNDGWHHGGGLSIGGNSGNPIIRDAANDGFGSMGAQATGMALVRHNIIRNNRVHESSLPHGAGMAVGMNAIVEHNEFTANDTVANGSHYGVGGALIAQHGVSNDTTNALIQVRNNWFEGNRAGKAGAAVFFDQTHAGYVVNNVFIGNIGPGTMLVDGACSNSCNGPSGNHDRNFMTLINNTLVANQGSALYVQDSTAHLYFNIVLLPPGIGDAIQLAGGSPGADSVVRGRNNIIATAVPGLSASIDPTGLSGVLDASHRLLNDTVGGMPAWSSDPSIVSAFTFAGSLFLSQTLPLGIDEVSRIYSGNRWLYGAYGAMPSGSDALFGNGYE